MIQIKSPAIKGNKSPLATWANFMISIDLNPIEENTIPKPKTNIQTNLNFMESMDDFQPKQPVVTYAAANGAVMALVIPAENKPTAKIYLENSPNNGSKPKAKSAALFMCSF